MITRRLVLYLVAAAALAGQTGAISARLKQSVDRSEIAGAVTLIAHRGAIVAFDAVGFQDIESKKPMTKDTIFQIMSMTKPVTAVGIMILAEEGKLSLGDPVEKYIPAFIGKKITIRDLMTHTSGLHAAPAGPVANLYKTMDKTLAEAVDEFAKPPLEFEPGTKWVYCNTGIATLGRIVEVASGQPYEKFIADRIFKPLGMTDSFFFPPPDKINRIATVYKLQDGKLTPSGGNILGGDPAKHRPNAKYPAPEFGLYSTAPDLFRFYQCMLNGGVWRRNRILSPAAVRVMTTNHTGGLKAGWLPGGSYGLAWEVVNEPLGTLNFLSLGTFHHGGAFGTHGWVDPKLDLIGVYLVQGENAPIGPRNAVFAMAAALASAAPLDDGK